MNNSFSEGFLDWYTSIGVSAHVGESLCSAFDVREHAYNPSKSVPLLLQEEAVQFDPLEQVETLEQLRSCIEADTKTSLPKTAMNLVFADGPETADIMFVGEAPGADEDRQGVPFVGQSGQLLNKMLQYADMPRESVYISNILPYRPPGNRTPTDAEVVAFLPYIKRHIELVNPRILIFLGGTSAKALLETTTGINRLRGKWQDYQGTKAMAIFHPAYLLRNPALKKQAWQDLLMVKHALKNTPKNTLEQPLEEDQEKPNA